MSYKKSINLIIISLILFSFIFSHFSYSQTTTSQYKGKIGNYPITIEVYKEGKDKIKGRYMYDKVGKWLKLEGKILKNNRVIIYEYDENNKNTGRFIGKIEDNKLKLISWINITKNIILPVNIQDIPSTKENLELKENNILYRTECDPREITCKFYSSFDGGKNWNLIKEQYKGSIVYDYDKKNTRIVYFGDSGFNVMAGGKCGFYKSTDGGKTFIDLTNKLPESKGIRCFEVI